MSKVVAFFLLMPFLLILLFQPALDKVEDTKSKNVQQAIQRGVERAAIDGYFTDENIAEIKSYIISSGFSEDEIEFTGNLTPVLRGEYIEGAIKVPNKLQFLLIENLLTGEITEKNHYFRASRMSEFVN